MSAIKRFLHDIIFREKNKPDLLFCKVISSDDCQIKVSPKLFIDEIIKFDSLSNFDRDNCQSFLLPVFKEENHEIKRFLQFLKDNKHKVSQMS